MVSRIPRSKAKRSAVGSPLAGYTYNAVGQITTWKQQQSGLSAPQTYGFAYDQGNQLTGATLTASGATTASYHYGYDRAGNRSQEQIGNATESAAFNSLNQLTGLSPGGVTHFTGTVNEWATVSIGGKAATVNEATGRFDGKLTLATGTNDVAVSATDASGNTATNTYQVTVPGGAAQSLTYDLNGNLIDDGTRTYQWDARNELTAITVTATGAKQKREDRVPARRECDDVCK